MAKAYQQHRKKKINEVEFASFAVDLAETKDFVDYFD